jgi:hypothetical protein
MTQTTSNSELLGARRTTLADWVIVETKLVIMSFTVTKGSEESTRNHQNQGATSTTQERLQDGPR